MFKLLNISYYIKLIVNFEIFHILKNVPCSFFYIQVINLHLRRIQLDKTLTLYYKNKYNHTMFKIFKT